MKLPVLNTLTSNFSGMIARTLSRTYLFQTSRSRMLQVKSRYVSSISVQLSTEQCTMLASRSISSRFVQDDAKGRFEAPEGSVFPTPQTASKTSASSASSIAVREPPIKKISLKEWADRRRAKEAEKTHSIVVREGDAFQ
jgi:hypothetical protein